MMLKIHHAGIAHIKQRIEHKQDEKLAAVLSLGIEEGQLGQDEDVAEVAAQIVGPLLFARLSGRPALAEQFARCVVDGFLRARTRVPTEASTPGTASCDSIGLILFRLPDGTIDDGYAVQQRAIETTPDFGVLFADTACGDGEPVPSAQLLQPRVEAEAAFVLNRISPTAP
jgi:hypothetical protein